MFTNCFIGTLVGFLRMLLNCCLIIEFKEKSIFMLKIWQKLAFPVFFIVGLFKVILILSIQDQMYENPEHELEVFVLFLTTVFDLSLRNDGMEHIKAALGYVLEESDEERRPLFEHKENITNNGSPVHGTE